MCAAHVWVRVLVGYRVVFQAVNFVKEIADNEEAEQLMAGKPVKSYFVWHVPFEDNLFRVTYMTEEGPFASPVKTIRCVSQVALGWCAAS